MLENQKFAAQLHQDEIDATNEKLQEIRRRSQLILGSVPDGMSLTAQQDKFLRRLELIETTELLAEHKRLYEQMVGIKGNIPKLR